MATLPQTPWDSRPRAAPEAGAVVHCHPGWPQGVASFTVHLRRALRPTKSITLEPFGRSSKILPVRVIFGARGQSRPFSRGLPLR